MPPASPSLDRRLRRELAVDAAIAVVLAAIVLIVSPGPAITGLVAVAIVLACMAAFAVSRRRRRP